LAGHFGAKPPATVQKENSTTTTNLGRGICFWGKGGRRNKRKKTNPPCLKLLGCREKAIGDERKKKKSTSASGGSSGGEKRRTRASIRVRTGEKRGQKRKKKLSTKNLDATIKQEKKQRNWVKEKRQIN